MALNPIADVPKPLGVVFLTLFEVGSAVVGLVLVLTYMSWAGYRFAWDDPLWGVVDGAIACAYLGISLSLFGIVRGLWRMQPWTWLPAVRLTSGLLGLTVLAVVLWGLDLGDLIGAAVFGGVLTYLNLTHVRRIFGRPPLIASAGSTDPTI
jgi:hypothetical protein